MRLAHGENKPTATLRMNGTTTILMEAWIQYGTLLAELTGQKHCRHSSELGTQKQNVSSCFVAFAWYYQSKCKNGMEMVRWLERDIPVLSNFYFHKQSVSVNRQARCCPTLKMHQLVDHGKIVVANDKNDLRIGYIILIQLQVNNKSCKADKNEAEQFQMCYYSKS